MVPLTLKIMFSATKIRTCKFYVDATASHSIYQPERVLIYEISQDPML